MAEKDKNIWKEENELQEKEIVYYEPADYFPKELRKKYELGEYNRDFDISLEEAIEIATSYSSKFNAYQEYEDAYEFYVDDGVIAAGGGERNYIIDKQTGERILWAEYFLSGKFDPVEIGDPVKLK